MKFQLKKDIPGGFKTGDIVEFNNTHLKYFWVTKNNEKLSHMALICSFDPTKEPDFFVKVIDPLYAVGSTVYLLEPTTVERKKSIGNKTEFVVLSSRTDNRGKVIYNIKKQGTSYELVGVLESKLCKPDIYWFINSKGRVCSDLIPRNVDDYVYKFRILSNNVFSTSDTANLALTLILNPHLQ